MKEKIHDCNVLCSLFTVNSEIFVRVLFSRNFSDAEFCRKKNAHEIVRNLCPLLM